MTWQPELTRGAVKPRQDGPPAPIRGGRAVLPPGSRVRHPCQRLPLASSRDRLRLPATVRPSSRRIALTRSIATLYA